MNHIDPTLVIRFGIGAISEEEELIVDSHIAECEECLEKIRTTIFLNKNVSSLIESWNATEHGKVFRRWKFAQTILETPYLTPSIAKKMSDAFFHAKDITIAGINCVMDGVKKITSVASSYIDPEGLFTLEPMVAGIGNEDVRILEDHRRKSSDLITAGKIQAALSELDRAAKIDRRNVQSAVSTIKCNGIEMMRIYSDARLQRVWVKLWPSPEKEKQNYIALLIPTEENGATRIIEFSQVENEPFLLVCFENIESHYFELLVQGV